MSDDPRTSTELEDDEPTDVSGGLLAHELNAHRRPTPSP